MKELLLNFLFEIYFFYFDYKKTSKINYESLYL